MCKSVASTRTRDARGRFVKMESVGGKTLRKWRRFWFNAFAKLFRG